jgi:hypothetical protein
MGVPERPPARRAMLKMRAVAPPSLQGAWTERWRN